jgi:tRNA dimethylallyltransferase
MPREALHARVDARVDALIERGLVDEVRALLAAGVPPGAPAMSSIGYRQFLPFLNGESPLETAIDRIKIDTHRYIHHQETWLRKNRRLRQIDVTGEGWLEKAMEMVDEHVTTSP